MGLGFLFMFLAAAPSHAATVRGAHMQSTHAAAMRDIFPKFVLKQLSTFIAITVIFIHNVVLDKNFECSCEGQATDCALYMALPFFILLFLILWMDKTFQRVWSYSSACLCACECPCACRQFAGLLACHVLKAAFIGALWVISVLIDGDWYVCCWNDRSPLQKPLACKDPEDLTALEKKAKAKLKSFSKDIGMWVLCAMLFLVAIKSPLGQLKCWRNSPCGSRAVRYHRVILDEEENVVKKILTTAAKLKLTESIKKKLAPTSTDWQQCFDVAKELINENVAPDLPEDQEENLEEENPEEENPEEENPEATHLLVVTQGSPDATKETLINAPEEEVVQEDSPV